MNNNKYFSPIIKSGIAFILIGISFINSAFAVEHTDTFNLSKKYFWSLFNINNKYMSRLNPSMYPYYMKYTQQKIESLTDRCLPEYVTHSERRHQLAKQRISLPIEPDPSNRHNLSK
jgi:hypothetical protein